MFKGSLFGGAAGILALAAVEACAQAVESGLTPSQSELERISAAPPEPAKVPEFSRAEAPNRGPKSSTPSLVPNFINFGYIQFDHAIPTMRWNTMTHVGPAFVDFLSDGSLQNPTTFTNRNADLRAGGAAQAAGTKVIVVVRNDNFSDSVLASCMASASARANLVTNVSNLVLNDSYCGGVNFDFEFSWTSATRDGITLFMQAMRSALPAHEISVYTHATYSSTRWNIAALEPSIDYMNYSTYDWATGNNAHAVADFNNCIPHINSYLNAGLPAHKMVLTWAAYGRRWHGASSYDTSGNGTVNSQGFADAMYDTTLEPQFGGPFTSNYVSGDEVEWFSYNNGTNYTVTWDSPASLEMKVRAALSMPPGGSGTTHRGKRLGGVGWWSLGWMTNVNSSFSAQSYNPIAGTLQSRARTYPHVYQLTEEILSAPGDKQFLFEGFEGLNPNWTDPNESPDTNGDTDNNSAVTLVTKPAGGPTNSTKAARVTFDFNNASGNRLFFRHEVLNDEGDTGVTDVHSAICHVDSTSRFSAHYHVAGNYSARTIRMALLDGSRQIEVSPAVNLPSVAGWHQLHWDLTDASQIQAYDTGEPAYLDGNGVLNTAGGGARDIRFLGFIIQGGGAGNGQISFDELIYEHRNPAGKNYVINEFRYNIAATEFVEIHGPVGAFPSGLQLRFFNSANGQVLSSVSLNGRSVPANGIFVVGDTDVPGTTGSNGFVPAGWGAGDNIPNTDPSAIQIYDTTNGCVYDSVTYEAMGGLDQLARKETLGVTGEGFGWIGEIGPGTDIAGRQYTMGRFPDGSDSQVNQNDFSMMPPSPGFPNGGSVATGTTFNFESAHPGIYQTYQSPTLVDPTTLGLPASPGGGNAWRVVDTTGGGVIGGIGDASLGSASAYKVIGQLYIPDTAATGQAVAVGIAGRGGSAFFSSNPDSSGYESGYWLIYESGSVDLPDGQPAHSGSFQFLHATNDNMHKAVSAALGTNRTLAQLGVTAGTWTTFELSIDPLHATEKLVARINGTAVYAGAFPPGGPTSGVFQAGFRDFSGTVAASEGTFLDTLSIQLAGITVPAAPSGAIANVSGLSIQISWADQAFNEDGFEITRKRDDEPQFTHLADLGANTTSYLDGQNLADGHQYCYIVRAYNQEGNSADSNTACVVYTLPVPPAAPSILNAVFVNDQVLLSWTDNANNEDGFVITRKRDDESQFTQVANLVANTTAFQDQQNLVPGHQYCYRIRAYNQAGSSANSNSPCVLIPLPVAPAAPSSLTAITSGGHVLLTWTDNSDNENGFMLERNSGNQSDFSPIANVVSQTVEYTDQHGLQPARQYCYRIKAFNEVGQSDYSTTACVTTDSVPNLIGEIGNPGLPGDLFGFSIARITAGKRQAFVVGAPGARDAGIGGVGRAYVFFPPETSAALVLENPEPSTVSENNYFGYAVSSLGESILVGAPGPKSPIGGGGRAYLFDSSTGALQRSFSAPDLTPGDRFGQAISAFGKTDVLIGAPGTSTGIGMVYRFNLKLETVTQVQDPSPAAGANFGHAIAGGKSNFGVVSLNGNCSPGSIDFFSKTGIYSTTHAEAFSATNVNGKLVIGAPVHTDCHETTQGYVYLFGSKSLSLKYPNPTDSYTDGFGYAVNGGKKLLAVGAALHDEDNIPDTGRAYLFRAKLPLTSILYRNPFPGANDHFGHAVAVAEKIKLPTKEKLDVLAVGAPHSDRFGLDAGAIYFFRLP